MTKKRFFIVGIILVSLLFLISLSQEVKAQGCCVGLTGCSSALGEEDCDETTAYTPNIECGNIPACDFYACCAPGLPPGTEVKTLFSCINISLSPGVSEFERGRTK